MNNTDIKALRNRPGVPAGEVTRETREKVRLRGVNGARFVISRRLRDPSEFANNVKLARKVLEENLTKTM